MAKFKSASRAITPLGAQFFTKREKRPGEGTVLTLWAAAVAEVLGFEHDEALTLGRAVAGLNAYLKGVSLGFFQPTPTDVKEQRQKMRKEETVTVDLLHRAVPAKYIDEGLRKLSGDSPIRPESVQKYLEGKFGDALAARRARPTGCSLYSSSTSSISDTRTRFFPRFSLMGPVTKTRRLTIGPTTSSSISGTVSHVI